MKDPKKLHALAVVLHALTILAGIGTYLEGIPLSTRAKSLVLVVAGAAGLLLRFLTMAFPDVTPEDDSANA